MRWTSMLAIYVLFWALSVFFVLPWGVRTTREAGGDLVPGEADSAAHEFRVVLIAKGVTIVATSLFALFLLNYHFGWIGPEMFDFSGADNATFD